MVWDNALCDPRLKKFVFLKLFISHLILFRSTQLVPILIEWQFFRMVITTSIPPISLIQEVNTLLISTTSINVLKNYEVSYLTLLVNICWVYNKDDILLASKVKLVLLSMGRDGLKTTSKRGVQFGNKCDYLGIIPL